MKDKILKMPAGREIDILILRDVLKYRPVYVQEGSLFGVVGELDCWYDEDGKFIPLGTSPSNDISEAQKVIDKILKTPKPENTYKGSYVRSTVTQSKSGAKCNFEVFGTTVSASGETAPLAICRAAYLVKYHYERNKREELGGV